MDADDEKEAARAKERADRHAKNMRIEETRAQVEDLTHRAILVGERSGLAGFAELRARHERLMDTDDYDDLTEEQVELLVARYEQSELLVEGTRPLARKKDQMILLEGLFKGLPKESASAEAPDFERLSEQLVKEIKTRWIETGFIQYGDFDQTALLRAFGEDSFTRQGR